MILQPSTARKVTVVEDVDIHRAGLRLSLSPSLSLPG